MAVEKNDISQAIHQKPPVEATDHGAGADQLRSTKTEIQGAPDAILAHIIEGLVDEIEATGGRIAAVAYGGQTVAEQSKDAINTGMFGAILSIADDAVAYIMLKDALAELHYRAAASSD